MPNPYACPTEFWGNVADEFYWENRPAAEQPILQYNFDVTKGNVFVKFMEGAKTNVCYNVLDRNVLERSFGHRVAYHW